jgi:uncharacterized protein (UPF0332 family)
MSKAKPRLVYDVSKKKKASTMLALALSELEAAEKLVESELHREAIFHLYFCAYYLAQSLLQNQLGRKNNHEFIQTSLHKSYGRTKWFPRRYVELHTELHSLRNEYNYKATHAPSHILVKKKLSLLRLYVRFAFRHVPRVGVAEIIESIFASNSEKIKDISYDIYCPKTYSHHTRITIWQPPFYLPIFDHIRLAEKAKIMLASLKVNRSEDYVVGLNSRTNQYAENHLLMLDIDTLDTDVEHELKKIGGVLLKSGRGFHFIGNRVISGQLAWEAIMKKVKRSRALKKHIDHDHIDISLRRGYATLRVTTSAVKPITPVFYKEI